MPDGFPKRHEDHTAEPAADVPTDSAGDAPKAINVSFCERASQYVQELARLAEGDRAGYARTACRIGLLALKEARGTRDAEALEGTWARITNEFQTALARHESLINAAVAGTLKDWFDPASGRLPERIRELVEDGGALQAAVLKHVEGENSAIATTLSASVGPQSPLMQVLDPERAGSVPQLLTQSLEGALKTQMAEILAQFSKDNPSSAVSRLLKDITERHGELETGLKSRFDEIAGEFDLNDPNAGLTRMLGLIETTQRSITQNLTLDDAASPLARIKRELLAVVAEMRREAQEHAAKVQAELESMRTRQDERSRGTGHGHDFEENLGAALQPVVEGYGDTLLHVGTTNGTKKRKVGDYTAHVSADCLAAGVNLVVEAKEDLNYDLRKALDELRLAKENRDAAVGVFVFSSKTAPEGLRPLARHGDDIALVWDAEDPHTDIVLVAAYAMARAFAVRQVQRRAAAVDLTRLDAAVDAIEQSVGDLAEIQKFTTTIANNSAKVLKATDKAAERLAEQVDALKQLQTDLGDLDEGQAAQ